MNQINGHKFSEGALEIIRVLEKHCYQTWIVGGCVRDAILGRESNDVDLATSAPWENVERICTAAGMKVRRSGTKHGTVTVLVPMHDPGRGLLKENDETISDDEFKHDANNGFDAFEVTTFRIDSSTSSDSRHPDFVEYTDSIVDDLARRDFTMNAMAWHPTRGLLDPFGGLEDIENKTIRVVGDPNARFKEDALRILRGCRFASQLGFSLQDECLQSMLFNKRLLLSVSAERITAELDLLLMGENVHDAIMDYVDVLSICVPELIALKGFQQHTKYHIYDVLEHTAYAVQHSKKSSLVRWAALCHDMGKPSCSFFDECGVQHFYGHAIASEKIARSLLDRLSFSSAFKEKVCTLVLNHNDVIEPTARCVKRVLARLDGRVDLMNDLFELKMADMRAHAPEFVSQTEDIEKARRTLALVIENSEAFSLRQLAINGNDVIGIGVAAGPKVGKVLNTLLDETIEGKIDNDFESLLDRAREMAKQEL